MTQDQAGSVVSIWRYPVKSMMGEELDASQVTERGLLGDRAYALIDRADGKVASAKNPRKWPQLFDFRATYVDPVRPQGSCKVVRQTVDMRKCWRREAATRCRSWAVASTDRPPGRSDLGRSRVLILQVKGEAVAQEA